MVVWACAQVWTAVSLRDDGVPTQAVIVSISDVKQLECGVDYRDSAGGRHTAWLEDQCRGMQEGQDIPVKYLGSDPSTVAAGGTLSLTYIMINKSGYLFVGLLLFTFGALGILACTGALERWVARRRVARTTDTRPEDARPD